MKSIFSRGTVCIVIYCFFFCAFPLKAENLTERMSWSIEGSILYFAEDNGNAGDPAPVLPSLGAAFNFQIFKYFFVELTEDLYFTHYAYNYQLNRAVPAAIENRSAFVFGFFTGLQALGRFPLTSNIYTRVYGGPALDLRIVTLAGNLHPDDFSGNPKTDAQIQTNSIREYFWGKGRWFLPVAGLGIDFNINEMFLLGLDLRVWFPLYKLYSGEDLPPIEGWRFGVGLRISPVRKRPVEQSDAFLLNTN